MEKIGRTFSGYLDIENDTVTYTVSDHIVTILPAQSDIQKQYEVNRRIHSKDITHSEYLFGENNGYRIAFMGNKKLSNNIWGPSSATCFHTPVIVKSCGNAHGFFEELTDDWTKFHAITFCGGNINTVYSPENALLEPDDSQLIDKPTDVKFHLYTDFTRSIDIVLDGTKAKLIVSVNQDMSRKYNEINGAYSLGELNAIIRLSFEEAQEFDSIAKYYLIMKNLISILVRQRNIFFNTYLSQITNDQKLYRTAVCDIYDPHENYAQISRDQSIQIIQIFNYLPDLIKIISEKWTTSLLEILPSNNKDINKITLSDIQNICTAVEATDFAPQDSDKDTLLEKLKKNIKDVIKQFINKHPEIDVYKQTTISSSFQYLNYTLKQKILNLYNENKNIIDKIVENYNLPQMNEENIGSFVKLRNAKTHQGVCELNNCVRIYHALLALVYIQLFKRIGMENTEIEIIISNYF